MAATDTPDSPPGWWGIWHGNVGGNPFKYSGGLGTYPWQHNNIAVHAAAAKKTFFVVGTAARDVASRKSWVNYSDSRVGAQLRGNTLQIAVGCYDHNTGRVSRPVILSRKPDSYDHTDAHENATLQMDDDGYLYVFINSHGPDRYHSFLYRSAQPHDISQWVEIAGKQTLMDPSDRAGATSTADSTKGVNFSYSHPWYLPGSNAFVFLHSKYASWSDRDLALKIGSIQPDKSVTWTNRQPFAQVEQGHYMVSARLGTKIGLAMNLHPTSGGLDARTNLYYCETEGTSGVFKTIGGTTLSIPMRTRSALAPTLIYNYGSEGLRVYLKDLQFDTAGRPVILFLTTTSSDPRNISAPRTWRTARWTGGEWEIRVITNSDHNYDHGSLWIEADGSGERWRLIAPTAPGPQPGYTGGEIQVWESSNRGASWQVVRSLSGISPYNSSFVRRVQDGHPDFAAIWADGDPAQPSESSFYFSNADATRIWRLPRVMTGDTAYPEPVAPGSLLAPVSFEGESFLATATATAPLVVQNQTDGASGNQWLHLQATAAGQYVELPLSGIPAGSYTVTLRTKLFTRRGIIQPSVNGAHVGGPIDCYTPGSSGSYQSFELGTVAFSGTGAHALRFTVTGKNPVATDFHVSIDKITLTPASAAPPIVQATILTASDAVVVGTWVQLANIPSQTEGAYYLHDGNAGKGTRSVAWNWTPPADGLYEIALKWNIGTSYPWNGSPDRAHNVPVSISHAGGLQNVLVDQREGDGFWSVIGQFRLSAGQAAQVLIGTAGTTKPVVADAVRFVEVPDSSPQAWRKQHFTAGELAQQDKEATLWGDAADPDSDGQTNLEERQRGNNPRIADATPPTLLIDDGMIRYRFRRALTGSGPLSVVEFSTDLSMWETLDAQPLVLELDDRAATLEISLESDEPRLFLREAFPLAAP